MFGNDAVLILKHYLKRYYCGPYEHARGDDASFSYLQLSYCA